MERFWKTILLLCVIYLGVVLVISPTACIAAAKEAIALCFQVVIPALFPFFVCFRLLVRLGVARQISRFCSPFMRPMFGVSGSGAMALVLGMISGYPVGASCAAELYQGGTCTKTESERLLAFCNNAGPLFVIGAVGVGMIQSRELGLFLYGIHTFSAILTGFLFRDYGKEQRRAVPYLPPAPLKQESGVLSAVGTAIADGMDAILKICGFVIFFAVFVAALPTYSGSVFVHGLLEITGGLKGLCQLRLPLDITLTLLSFFLALSGISVLLQVGGIIMPAGLSIRPYLLGKLTQAMIAGALTFALAQFLPQATETIAMTPSSVTEIATAVLSIQGLKRSVLAFCVLTMGIGIFALFPCHKEE